MVVIQHCTHKTRRTATRFNLTSSHSGGLLLCHPHCEALTALAVEMRRIITPQSHLTTRSLRPSQLALCPLAGVSDWISHFAALSLCSGSCLLWLVLSHTHPLTHTQHLLPRQPAVNQWAVVRRRAPLPEAPATVRKLVRPLTRLWAEPPKL